MIRDLAGQRFGRVGTRSCGCMRGPNKLPTGEANRNHLYRSYRTGARKRGLVFELTPERFAELTQQACTYCGVEPERVAQVRGKGYNGGYTHNGIGRCDSGRGYVEGNMVACCWPCNSLKGMLDREQFLALVCRIADQQRRVPNV